MSFCPTFCLSISQTVCLTVCLSPSLWLNVCSLSVFLWVYRLLVCESVCLPNCLSVHLNYLSVSPVCPSDCLVFCCFVSLSVCSDKDCDNVMKSSPLQRTYSNSFSAFWGWWENTHTHTHISSSSSSSRQSCLRVLKSFCWTGSQWLKDNECGCVSVSTYMCCDALGKAVLYCGAESSGPCGAAWLSTISTGRWG